MSPQALAQTRGAAAAAAAIAAHLTLLAAGMETAAAVFPGSGSAWQGGAAEALSHLVAAHPAKFRLVANACREAAGLVGGLADDLGHVLALQQQALQLPEAAARPLERQAAQLSAEATARAARAMTSLAGTAPRKGDALHRWVDRLDSWRGEILLGTEESAEGLINTVAVAGLGLLHPEDPKNGRDLLSVGAGLVESVRHPVRTGKSIVDWDTWISNPPRAVGHLLPDVAVALAGAGAGSGVQALRTAARSRAALETAARDSLRRTAAEAQGRAARKSLIDEADRAGQNRMPRSGTGTKTGKAWRGEGGARLSARQNASTETFHALSSAAEPSLTAQMHELSGTVQAALTGLGHRVKDLESLKRKLATEHARTGKPLPILLNKAQDAVRYTVVIDDTTYVKGVRQLAEMMERRGYVNLRTRNAWHSSRYRGLNTNWADPSSGAVFEVQFHTPASWRITRQTHGLYEEFRLPGTSRARKSELANAIAHAYTKAPAPSQAESLTSLGRPKSGVPEPIEIPVNYTVHTSIAAALAAGLSSADPGPAEQGR
jgi:hypothetical protein